METKDVILQLRIQNGWTQEELAEKLCVTRQAVSRWETGATTPKPATLKQLSALCDVSLHALLGGPEAADLSVLRNAFGGVLHQQGTRRHPQ